MLMQAVTRKMLFQRLFQGGGNCDALSYTNSTLKAAFHLVF